MINLGFTGDLKCLTLLPSHSNNNYPLPLISDLIDNIGKKMIFIKIDLRWKYNNIRIKKGDK